MKIRIITNTGHEISFNADSKEIFESIKNGFETFLDSSLNSITMKLGSRQTIMLPHNFLSNCCVIFED